MRLTIKFIELLIFKILHLQTREDFNLLVYYIYWCFFVVIVFHFISYKKCDLRSTHQQQQEARATETIQTNNNNNKSKSYRFIFLTLGYRSDENGTRNIQEFNTTQELQLTMRNPPFKKN